MRRPARPPPPPPPPHPHSPAVTELVYPVANLQDVWVYGIIARTGQPGVGRLSLGEIASLVWPLLSQCGQHIRQFRRIRPRDTLLRVGESVMGGGGGGSVRGEGGGAEGWFVVCLFFVRAPAHKRNTVFKARRTWGLTLSLEGFPLPISLFI